MTRASRPTTGTPDFTCTAPPARAVFGPGTLARVTDEMRRLGAGKALVLSTTPQRVEEAPGLADRLGDLTTTA
jgi:maleylacetate reductase